MDTRGSVLRDILGSFRQNWRELILTDITYKVIAFVLLTPLVGVLFRVLVSASGRSLLADQDILLFFLGPIGWICFIAVGALWLGIIALEQAALLGILAAGEGGGRLDVLGALQLAVRCARPVVLVTARLLACTLLILAPFVVALGVVYTILLGAHDINFFLQQKPPVFWVAAGIGLAIVSAMVVVLLRFVASWFYSLPLVLFEKTPPSAALRVSGERATGHRLVLVRWILLWAAASALLSTLATTVVFFVGRTVVPSATGALWLLSTAVGGTLLLWVVAHLAVNLFSTIAFAAMLFHLYRHLGTVGEVRQLDRLPESELERAPWLRLTRTRLVVAGLIGTLVAGLIGASALLTVRLEDHTQVTAHRGASAAAPENTMAAVLQAIEDGADWVEIDVQETADGEVVVFHDSDFMKLAGKELKIWDATREDLRNIDIGSWFAPEFRKERVPTLAAVLDACRGKVGVNIELKYYGHDQQLEERVARIVEQHGMVPHVVIMSLKVEAVEKMKALRPDWKVGLLMSVTAGGLEKINADFLAVNASFADRHFVRSAHAVGREVHVWTVNDAATISRMTSRGVDSVITDKPALARAVLKQRAQMSVPERALLELAGLLGLEPKIREQ